MWDHWLFPCWNWKKEQKKKLATNERHKIKTVQINETVEEHQRWWWIRSRKRGKMGIDMRKRGQLRAHKCLHIYIRMDVGVCMHGIYEAYIDNSDTQAHSLQVCFIPTLRTVRNINKWFHSFFFLDRISIVGPFLNHFLFVRFATIYWKLFIVSIFFCLSPF